MKCYIKDYPRPQFVRNNWHSLNGSWDFAFDDANAGEGQKWYESFPTGMQIQVPFTFETKASGIHDETRHDCVWYHRTLTVEAARLQGHRLMLHFEGCDYDAKVWVNGQFAGDHRGGYARFSFDITDLVHDGANEITVRAEDSFDLYQPRGKQRWRDQSFSVLYLHTTGIWKTAWCEYVPHVHLQQVTLTPDIAAACLLVEAQLHVPREALTGDVCLDMCVSFDGHLVNRTITAICDDMGLHQQVSLDLHSTASNTDAALVKLWSPDNPQLYDITFRVTRGGQVVDEVGSYFAMREITAQNGCVLLNGAPLYQRLLLDQGYWPDTLLTPPSEEAIIKDIDQIQAMGFNGVRKHQKVEDERFLYWADVKGLLVWGEMAAAFVYSADSAAAFAREWAEVVQQNRNHPCIVTWVPFNESWGITNVRTQKNQQDFANAVYYLTKALDPTRPVITNDGWEHTLSDIITLHDYGQDADGLKRRFIDSRDTLLSDAPCQDFPATGFAWGYGYHGQPVIISEYGGLAIKSDAAGPVWGNMVDAGEFTPRFEALTRAIKQIPYVCGYCYTQYADVQQEINGMVTADRQFKTDPATIRQINLD